MEERRKSKRLDLDVTLQLERLDQEGNTVLKNVPVTVTDLSTTGIGFTSGHELEIGSYYDTKIVIWTKEVIEAVLEIVRSKKVDEVYHYGGTFIGMTDKDVFKIDVYRMFSEADEKNGQDEKKEL